MDKLPNELLQHIFSFCGPYAFFAAQTCRLWRESQRYKICYLEYVDGLLRERIPKDEELCSLVSALAKEPILPQGFIITKEMFLAACRRGLLGLVLVSRLATIPFIEEGNVDLFVVGQAVLEAYKAQQWGVFNMLYNDETKKQLLLAACMEEDVDLLNVLSMKKELGKLDAESIGVLVRNEKKKALLWLYQSEKHLYPPFKGYICHLACRVGNMEMLEWGRSLGHDFNGYCYDEAIENEDYDLLDYLYKNKCSTDYHEEFCIECVELSAIRSEDLKVVDFMLDREDEFSSSLLLTMAICSKKLSFVLHILEKKKELWDEQARSLLESQNDKEMEDSLRDLGYEI